MIFKDYYAILGCSKSSSNEEIKKKYHSLALKYHPDKNPRDKIAEEKFKDINEAWSVLGDKSKREEYDKIYDKGKATKAVAKRRNVSTTKYNNDEDSDKTAREIVAILFLTLILFFFFFLIINNNLTFYKHFYNASLDFQRESFKSLLKTFLYIYTVIISFTPTYVLIYNTIRQVIKLTRIGEKENYIENIIAAIVVAGAFFLSFYKKIRLLITVLLFIVGNVYIIKTKIWKKFYGLVIVILMYLLFIPETFLDTSSKRKFEICDGRIWCPGERLDNYYKKRRIKNTYKKEQQYIDI